MEDEDFAWAVRCDPATQDDYDDYDDYGDDDDYEGDEDEADERCSCYLCEQEKS